MRGDINNYQPFYQRNKLHARQSIENKSPHNQADGDAPREYYVVHSGTRPASEMDTLIQIPKISFFIKNIKLFIVLNGITLLSMRVLRYYLKE